MNELSRTGVLRREALDEKHYLESLVAEAVRQGLAGPELPRQVQGELTTLLARTCRDFTGGNSSSVRTEVAEELSRSLLFTLGVWLMGYPEPMDALEALRGLGLAEGRERGYRRLLTLERSTRQFYRQVKKHRLSTENETYNATLDGGISGFFKLYRPDFAAHQIHITADYPVLLFPAGFEGLAFIRRYLEAIHWENLFCEAFAPGAVRRVLTLHAIDYGEREKEMVCDLCEPVLSAALSCAIGGGDPLALRLSPAGATQIKTLLGGPVTVPLTPYLEQIFGAFSLKAPFSEKGKAYFREVCDRNRAGLEQMILLMVNRNE